MQIQYEVLNDSILILQTKKSTKVEGIMNSPWMNLILMGMRKRRRVDSVGFAKAVQQNHLSQQIQHAHDSCLKLRNSETIVPINCIFSEYAK